MLAKLQGLQIYELTKFYLWPEYSACLIWTRLFSSNFFQTEKVLIAGTPEIPESSQFCVEAKLLLHWNLNQNLDIIMKTSCRKQNFN